MTAYAFPISDPSETDYLYLGSAEGLLYKVLFPAYQTEQIQWVRLGSVNPVGPAMSCIGTMRITDEVDETEGYVADIVVYAGEGSDSQIIAVSIRYIARKRPLNDTTADRTWIDFTSSVNDSPNPAKPGPCCRYANRSKCER